jgi:hypothetical protein
MQRFLTQSFQKRLLRSLTILFLAVFSPCASAQQWKWAVDAGGTGNVDFNKSIATDTDSNVYCAGTFGGNNVVFGSYTNPSTNNHIWGFICKYDRFGNFIWMRPISHSSNDLTVDRIAISQQNEIYLLGTTKQGTVGFGNGITLASTNPSTNMYLAKFDVSGNAQWARTLTTSGSSLCASGGLDLDINGNIYFSGTFTSSTSSPVMINGTTYTQNGASIFVIKYDTAGNSVWFRNTLTTGTGTRKAYGLSVANDQLYICGMVGVLTSFDTITIGSLPGQSCYIARYDLTGNTHWVTEYSGPSDTHLLDVSADDHNNIFAVGRHQGTVYVEGDTLVADGSAEDAVILCLDTLGNKKWSALVGSTQADWARAVDADGFGNAYVSGHLRGTIDFMGTPVTTSTNQTEIFVAKVSGAGPLKWIKLGGGPLTDYALTVHHEKGSNRVYTGGYYSWTATYGSSTINDVGNGDMMLIQLADTTFDVSWDVTSSCANTCNGSIAVFTNGNPVLYTWSNIPDNVSQQANVCAGIYNLTVTNTDGRTKTVQIEVPQTAPTPVVFNPVSGVCIDAPAFTLNGASPSGGSYTVNGAAMNVFDPVVLGVGTHEVGYVYTNASGCSDTTVREIVVHALPVLSYPSIASVCVDHAPIVIDNATPTGGMYSGNAVTGNLFAPTSAGAGNHTISYAYTDTNGCANMISQVVTVHALPVLTYEEVNAVCIDLPAFDLAQANPAGGAYSGNGVAGQQFDPAVAGTGNHLITYTYTDANGCPNSVSEAITVNPLPTLTYGGTNEACINDLSFLLTAAPNGGNYSGDGVTGNLFDPSAAGTGDHAIEYSYTNANGCSDELIITITVHELPAVSLMIGTDSLCEDGPAFNLSGGSPAGGIYAINGTNGNIFDPGQTGAGEHSITYTVTDQNGCSDSAEEEITVLVLPQVSYNETNDPVCVYDGPFALSEGTPAGGTHTGEGVSNGNFDPAGLTPGWHVVTYSYTDSFGCSAQTADSVFVDECLGIDPLSSELISVSPNPTLDIVNISTGNSVATLVTMLDSKGNIVVSFTPQDKTTVIDLSILSQGTYILQIEVSGHIHRTRVVKN